MANDMPSVPSISAGKGTNPVVSINRSFGIRITSLLLIVATLAACSSAASPSTGGSAASGGAPKTIFYMAPTLTDDYQAAAAQVIQQLGPQYGYTVKVLNANGQVGTQVSQMDDVIAQKPSAIVLNAVDPVALTGEAQKAHDAGIPVIALDREIDNTPVDFTSEIGTMKLGEIAAGEVARILLQKNGSETGNVLEVMGDASDTYTVYIDKGFEAAIAQYPNIHVTAKPTPGYDVARTASIVDDQLTAGKVDLIFVHSDFRIPAVVTSLQAHNFKAGDIPVIGTDGASSALQAIRDGWATETIGIPLNAEVGGSLQFISQILNKEQIKAGTFQIQGVQSELTLEKWGPTVYVPGQIVDKTNVDDPGLWGNAKKS
jgi:ribose transport system substrate-binding protein